ncbi:MAG: NAD(P)/FAD-dependent oxidoreductase [Methylacidiphilales bacterium]|nr:NAD(P)/FAD-dependent oxidoreductase [Candidatus Methylacidiphilales bacterium]
MTAESSGKPAAIIVGAGPAGLTAAAELVENGFRVDVLEKDPEYVGGIARTVRYKGYRFDIGGHRFFSKSPEVTEWWRRRLPDDFIQVRRMSRIFYRGKFFDYPLRAGNALRNLGIFTSMACMLSYLWSRLRPVRPEKSFADWVTNRFGSRLFRIFFKTYTEKVWGMPCNQISADWAAQRIKGLSLLKAIWFALLPQRKGEGSGVVKTLIDRFEYPRLGPGMMWEKTRDDIQARGGAIHMGTEVTRIRHDGSKVLSVETRMADGATREWQAHAFIISMPLRETIAALDPKAEDEVCRAAERLKYRDFLTVALMVRRADLFPDNWIYVHDPGVRLGRIQNFNNWSPEMAPGNDTTCLGLEYFCFEGDGLWTMRDEDLIELGKRELATLGLVKPEEVFDGAVVRMPKAYPVYGPGYLEDVARIRRALGKFSNLQPVGRNGLHKYNNQDHSMMTALLAARNLNGGAFDVWKVNTDAEYHEEDEKGQASGRRVPEKAS